MNSNKAEDILSNLNAYFANGKIQYVKSAFSLTESHSLEP